nr:hypothetical protein GCM10020092_051790 [Actinoplanes digitatis]
MMMTAIPPSRQVLTECVRTATAAPSLHNSQPWLFRIAGPTVEVYADPSRRLPVLDPDGREQLISVGAAIFNLRLAIRQAGYRCHSTAFPDRKKPDLVARVYAAGPAAATPAVEALSAAVPHRHTNRFPFAHTPVPDDVLDHLADAARREGATLTVATAAQPGYDPAPRPGSRTVAAGPAGLSGGAGALVWWRRPARRRPDLGGRALGRP